jgi:alkylation response protein AidB-like acyl-CoA dehydrogenase
MDFQPSPEQLGLQEGIRNFCTGNLDLAALRGLEDKGGFDPGLWRGLADLGVFQLRLEDGAGGLALGAADAALVFEELGRALCPGPLAWTELARRLVEGASQGARVVGGIDLAAANATPIVIEHPDSLDSLLVLLPDGVRILEAEEIESQAIGRSIDPLTPVAYVASLPPGREVGGRDEAQRLRLEGMGLVSAQLLGIAEATLTIALDYAKEREQFGRPIGSFQALKHMLSDMFARQELARASVYAAGALLDWPEAGDVERTVRGAKLLAGDAAMKNARACIQIHGGMGYTWEVSDHYYLKRCQVWNSTFGDVEDQSLEIAEALVAGPGENRGI